MKQNLIKNIDNLKNKNKYIKQLTNKIEQLTNDINMHKSKIENVNSNLNFNILANKYLDIYNEKKSQEN